jgi:hypothetical protein
MRTECAITAANRLRPAFAVRALGRGRAVCGDPAGALDPYTRSLGIFERLAAVDPGNTQYQRDRKVCGRRR